jgi:hypothetical protein
MKILLYSLAWPSGRCLVLAHVIRKATGIDGVYGLHLAQKLFGNQHSRDHPAIIELPDSASIEGLKATCAAFGIIFEIAE